LISSLIKLGSNNASLMRSLYRL